MVLKQEFLEKIKTSVIQTAPDSKIILFGSFARGEGTDSSDVDLLVLVQKASVSALEEEKIKSPLYDLEFTTGRIISPIILPEQEWEQKHRITPFYHTIKREGIRL